MNASITVRIANVYGRETIYPVCATAKLLAQLAGQKTITPQALALIERLGYSVRVQSQSLPV
jgi:hypothetical protein